MPCTRPARRCYELSLRESRTPCPNSVLLHQSLALQRAHLVEVGQAVEAIHLGLLDVQHLQTASGFSSCHSMPCPVQHKTPVRVALVCMLDIKPDGPSTPCLHSSVRMACLAFRADQQKSDGVQHDYQAMTHLKVGVQRGGEFERRIVLVEHAEVCVQVLAVQMHAVHRLEFVRPAPRSEGGAFTTGCTLRLPDVSLQRLTAECELQELHATQA